MLDGKWQDDQSWILRFLLFWQTHRVLEWCLKQPNIDRLNQRWMVWSCFGKPGMDAFKQHTFRFACQRRRRKGHDVDQQHRIDSTEIGLVWSIGHTTCVQTLFWEAKRVTSGNWRAGILPVCQYLLGTGWYRLRNRQTLIKHHHHHSFIHSLIHSKSFKTAQHHEKSV